MTANREDRTNATLVAATLCGLSLAVVAMLAATGIGPFADGPVRCSNYSFDHDAWQNDASREHEAAAVVRCDLLDGMTASEVRRLLSGSWKAESGNRRRDDLIYYISDDYLDSNFLFIRFSDGGRVVNARIYTG